MTPDALTPASVHSLWSSPKGLNQLCLTVFSSLRSSLLLVYLFLPNFFLPVNFVYYTQQIQIKLGWALFVTYTIIQSIMRSEMCSLHLTHPSVHTWSSGQPTVQRPGRPGSPGSSRGFPAGAGIRTHNLGLAQVSSPTLYPLGQRLPDAMWGWRRLNSRRFDASIGGTWFDSQSHSRIYAEVLWPCHIGYMGCSMFDFT